MNKEITHQELFSDDWRKTTGLIQRAIDDVAMDHGGRIVLPPGGHHVGSLQLRSGVELHLSEDTRLVAVHEDAAYPEQAWGRVIWADDAHDVALTGSGMIDCQARFERRSVPPGPPLPYTTYVGGNYRNINSPRPVFFHGCRNVRVSDVRLHNGGEWHCYMLACTQVLIEDIVIRQSAHSTWTDGIDLEGCRDVFIQRCDILTGDDAISVKTGKRGRQQSSHNIHIRDCSLVSETNGFKIGCETSLDIQNISLRNCRIKAHPDCEAAGPFGAISLMSVCGADVGNIHISDIEIEDARAPIFLKFGRGGDYIPQGDRIGSLRNITLERITARVTAAKDQEGITSMITGYQGNCVENVRLKDIQIEVQGGQEPDPGPVPDIVDRTMETASFGVLPAHGLYARYVRNLSMENTQFTTKKNDTRPPVILEHVE